MPILAAKVTQLNAAYNFPPVLCLISGDLSTYPTTVNATTDTFTATGHDFVNGTPITFTNSGGGLPAGIELGKTYFVINAATNTFKISATIGGSAVDITSTGSGTHTVTEMAMGDEDDSGALINQYSSGAIAWQVLVRHEVNYAGASRISFAWNTAAIDTPTNSAKTDPITVAIIPSTGEIAFRYAVVIRGGNTTTGNTTGSVEICQDLSLTITPQGQDFTFSPQLF